MGPYVISIHDADKTAFNMVGGKAANLGELMKIEGVLVPEGFIVTTHAYRMITGNNPALNNLLSELTGCKTDHWKEISEISARIRHVIEKITVPEEIVTAIEAHLRKTGESNFFAVRSSATAEDLPTASFAGQQDSFLNVAGTENILWHISKCWASLFTDRAVIYRLQNGFSHSHVSIAVVVQDLVLAHAAGIMFTADPITSNRKVLSIDASFGLGEATVSGVVNADNYRVSDGEIIRRNIATKKVAVYALKHGGTIQEEISVEKQKEQVLTDQEILRLNNIGRNIEKHFGTPQDIEWCLKDDTFYIVQSRPITTLFPVPQSNDADNHIFVSVGHGQMMTDAIKPLGLSVWQLTAARPMTHAGGRLFVDITRELSSPATREVILNVLGKSDPLIRDALTTILMRRDYQQPLPNDKADSNDAKSKSAPVPDYETLAEYDASIVDQLVKTSETSIEILKQRIQAKSGLELLDFIIEDIQELKKNVSDPQGFAVIMTALNAASWINQKMREWLGEKNVADILSQSVQNNVTSEMGLALLDVADVLRPFPAIIDYLQNVKEKDFLYKLDMFEGGKEVQQAILSFLHKYGMRCAGEIDITRTRWSENPATLIPLIIGNVKNFGHGASKRKFEQGLQESRRMEQDLLVRLKQLPDGEQKASETKRMINLVRDLVGYREYPKYAMVTRYLVYKQALMKEAEKLVQSNILCDMEDIYYLTFDEVREVIRSQHIDQRVIIQRKDEYEFYKRLSPPRVITSDGEIITGEYKREDLPPGAIVGLPVSSGIIEGRARVCLNMEDADLEEGDILVTSFTDPGWTTLFVSIKGLVTEVGGLMTHGSVIAREYGIPAVVGVENATRLIKDKQTIRVNGTEGFVEILASGSLFTKE